MKVLKVWAVGAALMLAAGAAMAQGPGGRGGFGGFGGGGMMGLLRMDEVQAEIKLDAAQKDLLAQLQQEQRTQGRQQFEGLRDLPREEQIKRIAAIRAEQEKKVAEILDAKQIARLKQLELQQMGVRALSRDDVANSLKLSADQKAKVQAALQGERAAMQSAFAGFRGGDGQRPSDEQRQAAFAKLQEVRTGTDAKLNGILTAAQKQQFQSMQGPAFKFPERRFGGRGNRNVQ